MGFGARKYETFNWCQGIEHRRLLDAAMRHIIAINDGEDIDPESGLPHRHHAAASLNMYCGMTVLHPELDDRYATTTEKQNESQKAKKLFMEQMLNVHR